jgi:hypothetical protein
VRVTPQQINFLSARVAALESEVRRLSLLLLQVTSRLRAAPAVSAPPVSPAVLRRQSIAGRGRAASAYRAADGTFLPE